jgi:hypothetical protein
MAEEKKPQPTPATPELTPEQKLLNAVLLMPEDQVLPWESVTLPSEGVYYDGAIPGGRVEVRPMGLFADKILATQRLAQSGKSLDWLFKKCVKFPDGKFDPLSLLAGDRIFLLYYLRGITHGNDYEFIVKCTNEECGLANTSNYDLNELYKTVIKPDATLGSEPFKVALPYLSKITKSDFWVKVRLLRGYDMQSMLTTKKTVRRVQNMARTSPLGESIDETLEDNLNMLIIEAMGSTDKRQIKELVSRMHSSDTAAIREFLRGNSPGIDTSILVNCSSCGNEMRMELPITEQFFRPTPSKRT